MERLRQHLKVEQWLLFGGSWGSTLALAYAEQYPHRVTEIILFGVTMTRPSEIDWLYRGVAPMFPEHWSHFRAGVPEAERDGNLVEAYYRLLHDPDAAVRTKAAHDWHEWEAASLSVNPDAKLSPQWLQPDFQIARARIVTHYFRHSAWLEDGILLRRAGALSGIPGMMIHGRLDLGAPLVTAWELAQVWRDAELIIVSGAGHSSADPGMGDAMIAATNRFASML
jgi:proline iminopeptidase